MYCILHGTQTNASLGSAEPFLAGGPLADEGPIFVGKCLKSALRRVCHHLL